MLESQQLSIKSLNAWLKNYPQGLSFMQRLLLCMNLYEAHDKAKSAHLYSTEQKLIVRTSDYCNINLTSDGLNLTSSIERTDRKEPISSETAASFEETTCEDDDQLSLALLCAGLLGYPHVTGIITRAQLFDDLTGCFKPEELLAEFADCTKDERETLSIILLVTAAKLTKYTSNEPKKIENVSGKSYDIVLLAHCKQLSSTHYALNTKLDRLRMDLDNYYFLNEEQRTLVHQEWIAADFLITTPEAIDYIHIKANETLATIWRDYCALKLAHLNTHQFEQDTPQNLLIQANKIKALCTYPMQPNPAMLQFILQQWAIVINLSQAFQQLKHYDPVLITDQFNSVLQPDIHHNVNNADLTTIWLNYYKLMFAHLSTHQFEHDTPQNLLIQANKIKALCTQPIEPNASMLQFILQQWGSVINLSQAFQQLKHYDPVLITDQFNSVLQPDIYHNLINADLTTIWLNYYKLMFAHLSTHQFEHDTPQNLLIQANKIKALCTQLIEPNASMLLFILQQWGIMINLSQAFQQMKHYDPVLITSQFNELLQPDTQHNLNEVELLLKSRLHQIFNNQAIVPLTPTYQHLYDRLCNYNHASSTCETHEWQLAQQLMQLYQLCHNLPMDKKMIPEAQDSFNTSFNTLYLCYQNYFINIINTGLNTYQAKYSRSQSRLFQKAPQRADAITKLFDSLDVIFQNSQDKLHSIKEAVISCITETKIAVEHEHNKGLGGALNLTKSELAKALNNIITALSDHDRKQQSYSHLNTNKRG